MFASVSLFHEAAMNVSIPSQALPSDQEVALARESGRVLSSVLLTATDIQHIDLHDDQGAVLPVRIPSSALRLLLEVLTEIGQGHAVSIIPIHAELTTQEAADVLNVSRPFLVQLLEKGDIPFHKTGTHRRVRWRDVMDYKNRIDAARHQALDDLAAQAQELGMGY
jgi:excisionase family DNA binding protein